LFVARSATPVLFDTSVHRWVNGTVNVGANRVFPGAFTPISMPFEIGTVVRDVNRVEIDRVLRLPLAELLAEHLFSEATAVPRGIEPFEALAVKTTLGLTQKFQVAGNRDDVLAVLPLAPYFEVAKQLGGDIGFERSFYCRAEAFLGVSKMG